MTRLLGAVCKDNYYNWLNRFTEFLSMDPTIPSAWGPGFDFVNSTLVPGALGIFFL